TESLICFLFLRVLRWFTSPSSLLPTYEFSREILPFQSRGFPHSEIPGSTLVCNSPRLIAADHVLHRLPSPRHSPCALSSLIITLILPKALSTQSELLQICRLPINIQLSKTSKNIQKNCKSSRMRIENRLLNNDH